MGLYEAGLLLAAGERPTFARMVFVSAAIRSDVFYLGLALFLIYLLWGRIVQIAYGLSTYRLHGSVQEFVAFSLEATEGHTMLIAGTIGGGVIAFFCAHAA